jgi:hypothetical protein
MTRYEVAVHEHGRKLIRGGGPCAGLLEWPQHKWTKITPRPIGLARATALANEQVGHATVQVWQTADVVYDNGKRPTVPDGWWPADAVVANV